MSQINFTNLFSLNIEIYCSNIAKLSWCEIVRYHDVNDSNFTKYYSALQQNVIRNTKLIKEVDNF